MQQNYQPCQVGATPIDLRSLFTHIDALVAEAQAATHMVNPETCETHQIHKNGLLDQAIQTLMHSIQQVQMSSDQQTLLSLH